MKATAYSAMRGLSIIAMITFLFSYGLEAQVKIHEKIDIAPQTPTNSPGKQYYTDINTDIGGDSIVVSFIAKMEYVSGAVLSIDPAPVYPAYAGVGMEEGEFFFLQGGIQSAIVGAHYHWGDPWNITYLELVDGGSGFTVGDYSAGCWTYGGCCIVVHVTAVSPTINTCVIVKPERSTILVGDTVNLFFQGDYSADQLFDIEVFGRGELLAPDGREGSSLTGVPQPIRYIAPPIILPSGVLTGSIRQKDTLSRAGKLLSKMSKVNPSMKTALQAQDGGGSCDPAYVTVIEPELSILTHAPWTIWPYLPPQNSDHANRGADRPGYNPKWTFSIQLTKGDGNPYPDQQINIFTKYEEGSGGHDHTGYADTGGTIPAVKSLPDTLQGLFYYKGEKIGKNPLTVTTGANGKAVVDSFIASQASGKFLITARMVRDTTIMDTVNLQVKVDGFVQFGTGDYWNLTGNTSNRGRNHLSNHWCTQKTKDSLETVLKDFYVWTKTKAGGGKAVKLGINDMCLELGGVFDIPGTWKFNDQHSFHRVGLSVDIDNVDLKTYSENEKPLLTDRGNKLVKIMTKYGGKIFDEGPIHFGFEKGN
ncbi:MAG: hypothetical protein ABSD46_04790 [Bacteroidota bacterium]